MSSEAVRTQGDGTEHPDVTADSSFKKLSQSSSVAADNIDKLGKEYLSKQTTSSILYDPSPADKNQSFNYPPAVQPRGKRFYLIPKMVKSSEESRGALKNRKLNLVLMEPYKVS